ncbi:radical SAM protein [bacterium]|nr:radical SAM protein [bacterium]
MSSIYTAPVYKLKELNNLFIELTAKNCNQRCKCCYIDFPINSKIVKDFISLDRIKEALSDLNLETLHCIYLTGAEPMLHPEFNVILRYCLKKSNVCICTNGYFLNEKKIRFLRKVEEEGCNQIFIRLSLTHYDERENDSVKYRGHYRQTIFALKTLSRYNFSSALSLQNYYNLEKKDIEEKFLQVFKEHDIVNTELQISTSYLKSENEDFLVIKSEKTDCMFGRVLGVNGIYACPYLSNDYRGRVGTSFKNFSTTFNAETDFCATCSKNNNFVFTIG